MHCDGGGLREFQMNREVKFDEILQKAKEIYFPNGKSQKGSLEDMSVEMSDFTLKPITRFTDLDEQECTYKTHLSCRGLFPSRSAVILMTRKTNTVNDSKNTTQINQPTSMQTSADDRSEENDYVANKNPISLPRASIKYSKVKQSMYCPDTISINITGRDQVKTMIQQEHGEEVSDPLDYDFSVHQIKIDGKVFLDTEITQNMTKETVVGLRDIQTTGPEELKFIFPSDIEKSTSTIVHGPNEIFGLDGEEIVIGIVCRNHENNLMYNWYRNDEFVKSGTKQSLLSISENGIYYCKVEDGNTGKTQKSDKITYQEINVEAQEQEETGNELPKHQQLGTDRHQHQEARDELPKHQDVKMPKKESKEVKLPSEEVKPNIPIIKLTDIHFSQSDEIGKGSFARVYRGNWIGSAVAIRIVDLKKKSQSKIKAMVEEEIKIHSKIRHPNIVQLMAVAYDIRSIVLVSEFVNGFNMEDMIFEDTVKSKVTVTFQNKLYISMQCLQAISYLHGMENPIIHRDVKPANILIDRQSFCTKICDLGVSRVKCYSTYSMTNIGGQPGTPAYMAPEVIVLGKGGTMKSDIWSIGASLIELFAEEEA